MSDSVRLSIIVAMDRNGLIGTNGQLPWHLPGDLKRFRKLTMGKPIIMGRKTFASLPGPLDGRKNIVLSRDPGFTAPGCTVVDDLDKALAVVGQYLVLHGGDEVMVIGGESVYREALPHCSRIYLTRILGDFPPGDAYFPPGALGGFRCIPGSERFDEERDTPYWFCIFDREGAFHDES